MISSTAWGQFMRYATVGLGSNLMLYISYLGLTAVDVGHKTAMTLTYVSGVLLTFLFNRRWSFAYNGTISSAFLRYVCVYAFGYVLNLVALVLLVDNWGWSHQWVQGVMIFVLAGILFLLQRYWVFRSNQGLST